MREIFKFKTKLQEILNPFAPERKLTDFFWGGEGGIENFLTF